jgi:hypothetical protein
MLQRCVPAARRSPEEDGLEPQMHADARRCTQMGLYAVFMLSVVRNL